MYIRYNHENCQFPNIHSPEHPLGKLECCLSRLFPFFTFTLHPSVSHNSLRIRLHPGCLPWNSTEPSRVLAARCSARRAWHQYLVPNCHTGAASQPLQMYTGRSHISLHSTPCLMYQTARSPHALPDIPDFIHLLPDILNGFLHTPCLMYQTACSPHVLPDIPDCIHLFLPGILNCCSPHTLHPTY